MSTIRKSLENYVSQAPDEPWIIGYGWINDLTDNPSGVELDAIVPDRPMLLVASSGHAALVNTVALDLAGITDDTPDPAGGVIVRDPETGKATGLLLEEALALVSEEAISTYSDAAYQSGLENQLQNFTSYGLTGVSEILAAPGFDLARPWIYTELEEAGKLPLRVHYYAPVFKVEDIAEIATYREDWDRELVRFAGGKVWVDGSMSAATAWVSEPHVDDPEDHGIHYFDVEQLTEIVRQAESRNIPLKFHVNGDAAIAASLDALETIDIENGGLTTTPIFEHAVLPGEGDRTRMATLGVVASLQPIHYLTAQYGSTASAWGESRFDYAYDSVAYLEAGIDVALGTDWPVWPSADVSASIWASATARGDDSLSIPDAIRGYTQGSAASVGRTDLGHLFPGAKADIVVLDRDLSSTATDALNDTQLVHIFVNGQMVR